MNNLLSVNVHIGIDYWVRGSVLNGTFESDCNEVRANFVVEYKEPEAKLLEVIRLAKTDC